MVMIPGVPSPISILLTVKRQRLASDPGKAGLTDEIPATDPIKV
jgi:hypothetical protein